MTSSVVVPLLSGVPSSAEVVVVPAWESLGYLYGPLVAFLVMGVLALVLRWVCAPPRPRRPAFGTLVPVTAGARPRLEAARALLRDAGLRSTLGQEGNHWVLLVFPEDLATARTLLGRWARSLP